jgi:hypothetical protein
MCVLGGSMCLVAACAGWQHVLGGSKDVTTTQCPRRLIKEKAEVRQSQGSVPPFPHRGNIESVQLVLIPYLVLKRTLGSSWFA